MARDSVWYRIGYAFESARHGIVGAAASSRRLPSPDELRERLGSRRRDSARDDAANDAGREGASGAETAVEVLLAGAAGTLLTRLLNLWPGRGRSGPLAWTRGAAAGAGATLVTELLRPALTGRGRFPVLDDELADALLAGAGRGLLYAAVLEPRLPGPTPLRGAAYGALEYAVSPWGGLGELLGPASPARKIPVVGPLLEEGEAETDASLTELLAFGVTLALVYGRTVYRLPPDDEE